jgi:hypothetical protein
MRGLDPRIHPLGKNLFLMDCRVKPGNDDCGRALRMGRSPARRTPMLAWRIIIGISGPASA